MKSKVIHAEGEEKTFVLVFETEDEVVSEITNFAESNDLDAATITAIGAFSGALLGYFDIKKRQYEKIPVEEQVEVLSPVGDVALNRGEPELHAHVVLGRRDQGWALDRGPIATDVGGHHGRVARAPEDEDRRGDGTCPHRLGRLIGRVPAGRERSTKWLRGSPTVARETFEGSTPQ